MNAAGLAAWGWPCPTGEEMGRIDRDAIERGLPGRLLMESAGRAVALAIRRRFPEARRPLVVCGSGNNGGDGFVIARVLRDWDDRIAPRVVALGEVERSSPETRENLQLLLGSDVEVVERAGLGEVETALAGCDLVVDAVFGVGLTRPVEGPLGDIMGLILGLGGVKRQLQAAQIDDDFFNQAEAIVFSMTPEERRRPDIINGSRRRRIAAGSGTTPREINQLLKQWKEAKKMMQMMASGRTAKMLGIR